MTDLEAAYRHLAISHRGPAETTLTAALYLRHPVRRVRRQWVVIADGMHGAAHATWAIRYGLVGNAQVVEVTLVERPPRRRRWKRGKR
jgi:hypothetical protein